MSDAILQHEILQDLKRIAKELTRAPTRNEYREMGKYPDSRIEKEFGTFSYALHAAGLNPSRVKIISPESRAFDNHRKNYQHVEQLKTRFEEQITPYIGKYTKPHKDIVHVAYSSDHHSVWMDEFAFHVFLDYCRRTQPGVIGLVGDVVDFYLISRFSKDPSRVMKLQAEIDYVVNKIFKPLREACPDAQIDFFMGNHEWRLFKFICSESPALASLRCLRFDELFELEKYKINLVAKKTFVTTKSERELKNYKVYHDLFVLTHGMATSKYCADKELKTYNLSGASGHVHRNQVFAERDLSGVKKWTSLGCMCKLKLGEEYMDGVVSFQQGFGAAHLDLKRRKVVQEYIDINDGFALAAGVYYLDKR